MTISAALVKELRERTGSGMMECKKALVEAAGDIDAAAEALRKQGIAKADKKAGRTTAEGAIIVKRSPDQKEAAMVEINCETDFVARDESFRDFAEKVADRALAAKTNNLEDLVKLPIQGNDGQTIEAARQELVAKLGENINIRRVVYMQSSGSMGVYKHGERIGVLIALSNDNQDLGRDLAMHVAASNPKAVTAADLPQDFIEKEKEIFSAQAQASGKPAEIIEKMVEGRVTKLLSEVSLVGQPFVKDPDKTVGALLNESQAKVTQFIRFEVGEGIEKKVENFADEVMAQVRGSE
jgi:elongation factor Ts